MNKELKEFKEEMYRETGLRETGLSEETDKMVTTIDFLSGNKLLSLSKEDLQSKSQDEIIDLYADTALFHYMTELLSKRHYQEVTEKQFNNLLSDKEKDLFKKGFMYGLNLQFAEGDNETE